MSERLPDKPRPKAAWVNGICKTCSAYTHSCKCEHPNSELVRSLFAAPQEGVGSTAGPATNGEPAAAAPVSAIARKPTEAQADSVRGILQVIRGKTGATFPEVYEHCRLRGDDMSRWPQWARNEAGYVTEIGAACLIYEVMARADDGVEKP